MHNFQLLFNAVLFDESSLIDGLILIPVHELLLDEGFCIEFKPFLKSKLWTIFSRIILIINDLLD